MVNRVGKRPLILLFVFIAVVVIALVTNLVAFSQQPASAVFAVGTGYTDVVPRQLVRASDDRVYIFAPRQEGTNGVSAYWTTAAGLPNNTAAFNGSTTFNDTNKPLSLDAVYDGGNTIHVLINNNAGELKDYPFDIVSRTFRSPITLATGNPTVPTGDYIGTVGVSGMFDTSGTLQVAYWAANKQITHRSYTYNAGTNALTLTSGPTRVDVSGSSNHPAVAISPVDNSLTVAWVSEATSPAKILARTRTAAGVWGGVETVSTSPVWVSTTMGINIDQGPSLIIDGSNAKHLTYIENYDGTGRYGKTHYAINSGSGWVDTATTLYSHDPGLAINSANEIYIIGHGPESTGQNINLYYMRKTGATTWTALTLLAAPPSGSSFDASPSIKWGVVGWNRPDQIEFAFFLANGGNYYNTTLYYARLPGSGAPPATSTPVTPTSSVPTSVPPTAVPPTAVPPTAANNDAIFSDGFEGGTLNAWPGTVTDGGDLFVSPSAALVGTKGIAVVIDDNNNLYLNDNTPANEGRYRVRFYFDPNTITMTNNTAHYIFYGANGSAGVVRVEFGRQNNSYALRAGLINDGTSWSTTSWTNITDSTHSVEFDWAASTASGANNGSLTFWVDGAQVGSLTGIDNDSRRIETALLGAVTEIDTSSRGTYYIDAFESRRQSYIGTDPTAPTPVPPTAVPPTAVPPTGVPPTAVPPTAVPPTGVPPTAVPPTAVPPTAVPPTAVPPSNQPPVANPDSLSTAKNTPLTLTIVSLLNNDSDPNGDPLSIANFTNPGHGTLTYGQNGTGIYTPTNNYVGTDSFTYTITDGKGGQATGTVTITVGP